MKPNALTSLKFLELKMENSCPVGSVSLLSCMSEVKKLIAKSYGRID